MYTQKKLSDENHHQSKWVYHEAAKTEGTICSKMCNGIQRYRINPVCMNNQNKVDEHMCLNEKAKPKYIEKPCNTNCRLQYSLTHFIKLNCLYSINLIFKYFLFIW